MCGFPKVDRCGPFPFIPPPQVLLFLFPPHLPMLMDSSHSPITISLSPDENDDCRDELISFSDSPPLDDDKKLYQYCVHKSLEYLRNIPSSPTPSSSGTAAFPFTSPKSLFTIEKGTGKSVRYTIRTKTKRYFYIFPWVFYLQLKKTQRNDTSFFRETMEEDYVEKVIETMNYFYRNCKEREFTKEELLYLKDIFQELEWERDKEKNLITRSIQISSSLKRYRSLMSKGGGTKRSHSEDQRFEEVKEDNRDGGDGFGEFLFSSESPKVTRPHPTPLSLSLCRGKRFQPQEAPS
jgi:hypothetical protein